MMNASPAFSLRLSRGLAWFWLAIMAVGSIGSIWFRPILDSALQSPSARHWLGTDLLGQDVLQRIVQGGGWTIGMAGAACLLSVVVGGGWGIAAGFFQGWFANLLTRLMDGLLSIPALLMALVWVATFGPGNGAVILAVGLGGVATFAKLSRAEAAHIAARDYIQVARALGASEMDIIRRHLLPNMLPALAAYGFVQFSWSLTNTTALTFLGFGGSLFAPDWGRMLGEARLVFWQAPWQALAAGAAIAATVLAAQHLGEHGIDTA